MNPSPTVPSWTDANQRLLTAALDVVRARLAIHAARLAGDPPDEEALIHAQERRAQAEAAMPSPSALASLSTLFGLSPFEEELLLLCAGMEMEAAFPGLCAQAQADPQRPYPTFGLALAALPQPHWSALSPGSPLRYWRLLELGAGPSLVTSPLRLDERLLHFLAGVHHLDEQLVGFVQPLPPLPLPELVPSHQALAQALAAAWSQPQEGDTLPEVQLCGPPGTGKQAIARAAVGLLGMNLHVLWAQALPTAPHDLEVLVRLWEREAVLSNSALLLDCHHVASGDPARESLVQRFLEQVKSPLILSGRERRRARHRPLVTYDVAKPTRQEQHRLWSQALGPVAARLNGQVERLTAHFDLNPPAIRAATSRALGEAHPAPGKGQARLEERLWEAVRSQARPRLDDLAQRIEPVATWADLVLPPVQLATLREIAIHVRQRAKVYDSWGFRAKSARGLGISALFAGPSGTGKTMAAEVLAHELRLDLYCIDLSQVVSKYIGETEKNLGRVFDAAEEGGAILLFDEADALFGKRSEVKDSHDRYANIEVSYLLQRMEAYRGLAILTSNMKQALDDAFLRRIRFVVQFPFPDRAQRAAIWQHIFPAQTPTEGLDWSRLAQLNVAGGNIRNIALHAAFLAAEAGQPVRMEHILAGARVEYAKLEKPLTAGELRGWPGERVTG